MIIVGVFICVAVSLGVGYLIGYEQGWNERGIQVEILLKTLECDYERDNS